MRKKILFSILGIVFVVLLFSFLSSGTSASNLDVTEFSELISSEEVFLINAHTPYIGEIEGTDLIAEKWDNIPAYSQELPEDKSTPIAVYCRSGSMASTSAEQLIEMGYENVYNLEGGMNEWENYNKPIVYLR